MKRFFLFLLLFPFYLLGYVVGCLVWASLIVWAALVEAYVIGRGLTDA